MKIKYTRPELKKQREKLRRFERYVPMLELKSKLLQNALIFTNKEIATLDTKIAGQNLTLDSYRVLLDEPCGLSLEQITTPSQVSTQHGNIAGISFDILTSVRFDAPAYSLLHTPAWVDKAVDDLRSLKKLQLARDILFLKLNSLKDELKKVNQRLNLFEKVVIPETGHNIQTIRIHLGDEQTAAVGRAKIAKRKMGQKQAKGF